MSLCIDSAFTQADLTYPRILSASVLDLTKTSKELRSFLFTICCNNCLLWEDFTLYITCLILLVDDATLWTVTSSGLFNISSAKTFIFFGIVAEKSIVCLHPLSLFNIFDISQPFHISSILSDSSSTRFSTKDRFTTSWETKSISLHGVAIRISNHFSIAFFWWKSFTQPKIVKCLKFTFVQ